MSESGIEILQESGIDPSSVIVIDTETTGLGNGSTPDEVLSLSIIDGYGNVLFDDYVKPRVRKRWPNATKINGITWADVCNKQTLVEQAGLVTSIIDSASVVVGYNVEFDLRMLKASGLELGKVQTFDVMKEYAACFNGGRWLKLTECATRNGYEFDAHSSIEDCRATLHCYFETIGSDEYRAYRGRKHGQSAGAKATTPAASEGTGCSAGCGIAILAVAILIILVLVFLF